MRQQTVENIKLHLRILEKTQKCFGKNTRSYKAYNKERKSLLKDLQRKVGLLEYLKYKLLK